MRILFCNYEYPPLGGGGGVVNALLAEELAKRHSVTVLTSKGLGLPALENTNGVDIIRVPVFFRNQTAAANLPSMLAYLPMGIYKGRKLLSNTSFDVINTHFALPTGPVGHALSSKSGIPNVLSVHGGDLYDPSKKMSPHRHWILRKWIKRLLLDADCVVGQSNNTIQNVARYYTSKVSPVRIPLGIRRPTSGIASRDNHGFAQSDVLIATVGRLVSRKAVDRLIHIIANLDTSVHLVVLGDGPQEPQLRKVATDLGIDKRIHFMGFVDEASKFSILRMCDIFASTSQHEGFGLVFLEAMSSGLPIICYDNGGQTDFLSTNITGFVLPLNDETQFTTACKDLSKDADRRKSIGKRNLIEVENFYIDRCAEMYEEIFFDLSEHTKNRNAL